LINKRTKEIEDSGKKTIPAKGNAKPDTKKRKDREANIQIFFNVYIYYKLT